MKTLVRRPLWLALMFSITWLAAASAHAAEPNATKAHERVAANGIGGHVKLLLADHTRVDGTIVGFDEDSVEVLPKGKSQSMSVPFMTIAAVRDRSSLGSRFVIGPCIGPVTLLVAAPFITAVYLAGH